VVGGVIGRLVDGTDEVAMEVAIEVADLELDLRRVASEYSTSE
jgi:hypothetical protein